MGRRRCNKTEFEGNPPFVEDPINQKYPKTNKKINKLLLLSYSFSTTGGKSKMASVAIDISFANPPTKSFRDFGGVKSTISEGFGSGGSGKPWVGCTYPLIWEG